MSYIGRLLRGAEINIEPIDEAAVARALEAEELARQPVQKPTRPGEGPAVPYIANTFDNLTKISDKYHHELSKLDADIARLTEERRQLAVSVAALETAIHALGNGEEEAKYDAYEIPD